MVDRVSFDTTFLIDYQRERVRQESNGPAHVFLGTRPALSMAICAVALGEFAEGFSDPEHDLVQMIRSTHDILPIDEAVAAQYARITRKLRGIGQLIGTNDLWIGAAAVRYGLPLVTANVKHFARIPGLEVLTYRFGR